MTTSLEISRNVSARADGFQYVKSDNVAVVSVVGRRSSLDTSLPTVMLATARRFQELLERWLNFLPLHRILLFVATTSSDQQNILSRRRGVWGSEGVNWIARASLLSPSIELSGERGTRFAGVAELGLSDLPEAADFARTHSGSLLFVSPIQKLSELDVRAIAAKVFSNGDALDWARVIDGLDETEEIRIRTNGGFDDREVSLDAFMSVAMFDSLGPA